MSAKPKKTVAAPPADAGVSPPMSERESLENLIAHNERQQQADPTNIIFANRIHALSLALAEYPA